MRFYSKTNILYNSELSLENIYLFGIFVLNVFITFLIIDLLKGRMENLLNYIPYLFLFIGTYLGTNLNFYLLLLSCIGISYYFKKKSLLSSDKYFIFFLIFWVINIADNNYFFDGDKLRGFVNSNLTLRSQLFWIFLVFFTVRGLLYAINKNKESFNILKFINNFLVSGSMIVILGILGSISPLFNFFNFYIFGQNKRGMKELSSIAGNTWRGFSASAESIGEVFAFLLLILFMLAVNKKVKISNPFNLLLIFIFYGLIRSNNFAAMSSMIILIIFYLYLKHYKGRKVFIYLSIVSFIIASTLIGFSANFDYKFSSSNLIYESTRHQNFYENLPLASNQSGSTSKSHYLVLEAIDKNDVGTILLNDENLNNASSSYKFLLNVFTPNLNLKFIPNIVGLISIVSLYINRSEMWGIFIAKYDPNIFDFLFGYGPQQLNSYLFEQEVRLDVPSYKASSLFLPHSSLLDVLMFFGFLGTFAILIYTFKIFYNSHPNNYFFFPTIFLVINFIKSDSILYINSFVLIIFCVQMLKSKVNENE
tara:strand:- start:849 stop:2456 length:1608 start_codon:yes stop_codon:yes gene_type:complete